LCMYIQTHTDVKGGRGSDVVFRKSRTLHPYPKLRLCTGEMTGPWQGGKRLSVSNGGLGSKQRGMTE
jgi:hypothetical protein